MTSPDTITKFIAEVRKRCEAAALADDGFSNFCDEHCAHARIDRPRALEMLEVAFLALKGISYGEMINPHDRANAALDRIAKLAEGGGE